MSRVVGIAGSVCAAVVVLAGVALAQEAASAAGAPAARTISGQIIGDDNVRVAGAKVLVVQAPAVTPGEPPPLPERVDLVESRADGTFLTNALPPGRYQVTIEKDGYDEFVAHVTVEDNGQPHLRDFLLTASRFWMRWGSRSGLDLALLQPGSFAYFDAGKDDEGEVDLFVDGKLGTTVQLVGADAIAYSDRRNRVRLGLNVGVGLGTANEAAPTADNPTATKSSAVVMLTMSFVADFAKVFRLQAGWSYGLSAREAVGSRDDSAIFVGLTLRTQLGEELVKLIR